MVVSEEYSPSERQSFALHVAFAVACLPFYYLMPKSFGLLISPYVIFLAVCPKPQYLLPVIIHIAYGSQQRYFFCMGCFLYVLFHFNDLYRYGLRLMFGFYLFIFPFFAWYFFQKFAGPRYVGGIGEVTGGIGEYFVFSTAFWGVLVVKKLNRTFFRGLLVFMLFLLAILSFAGAKDEDTGALITGVNMFSREVFFAMPLLVASVVYFFFRRRQGGMFEFMIAGIGTLIICLDFVHVLRMQVTFTNIGGCLLAALYVFLAAKRYRVLIRFFHPFVFLVVSCCVVLASAFFVEKYGGQYADEGKYEEMSVTDLNSFLKKLQRKAVDDRAQVWSYNIAHIKEEFFKNPIWVNVNPYLDQMTYVPGKGYVTVVTNMGSHNTMLQLLRRYGWYGGLGLYLLFVVYFSRRVNLKLLDFCNSGCAVILMATCLSQGVIGGHTGHYPVQLTFGPVLFSCLGACWRSYYNGKSSGLRLASFH